MSIEIVLLCSILCAAIGVASFFGGKLTAARGEGERRGRIDKAIEVMGGDIKDIRGTMRQDMQELKASYDKASSKYSDELAKLHRRMDEHLRDYHNPGDTRAVPS